MKRKKRGGEREGKMYTLRICSFFLLWDETGMGRLCVVFPFFFFRYHTIDLDIDVLSKTTSSLHDTIQGLTLHFSFFSFFETCENYWKQRCVCLYVCERESKISLKKYSFSFETKLGENVNSPFLRQFRVPRNIYIRSMKEDEYFCNSYFSFFSSYD